ncbi:hypothetical protein BJ508DRAFT_365302 [Ascobolus immersus RN42]|uniref:Uncharacterized protein n=1 Tax=Ascobolus immersus RN42 TaxID=1160509 RepID=A0A3N4I298_ASCIM|nr:hypothetical protein BJ508DRAFT_365302 [Ascobolus immersus RN42]
MKFSTAFISSAFVAFAGLAAAENYPVYACVDINWQNCVKVDFQGPSGGGTCWNFGDNLHDKISSVGPDPGNYCIFYVDINCSGDSIGTGSPGWGNLATLQGGKWNDKFSSVKCWKG